MWPNEAKCGQMRQTVGYSGATVGTQWCGTARTHTTGCHQDPHHAPYTHYPGTTTRTTSMAANDGCRTTAGTGSPGFFRIQSQTLHTELVKPTTFLTVKNRPVKKCKNVKKAYLILITFAKISIFDVFAKIDHFLTISRHHWFTTGFSLFSLFQNPQVFPRTFRKMTKITENHWKSRKMTKMATFLKNVTDKPDVWKSVIFDVFSTKNSDFRHFPLGLDRGFGQKCQSVPPWCPLWCPWCQNWQFCPKPLSKPRGKCRNWRKSLFFTVFTVFHCFSRKFRSL